MDVNLSFNHIGWAVRSTKEALKALEALGFNPIEGNGGGSLCALIRRGR